MTTYKFKTNINCKNCVARVTPLLNNELTIKKWEVDTISEQKTLSVETDAADSAKIIEAVKKAGFSIEQV